MRAKHFALVFIVGVTTALIFGVVHPRSLCPPTLSSCKEWFGASVAEDMAAPEEVGQQMKGLRGDENGIPPNFATCMPDVATCM